MDGDCWVENKPLDWTTGEWDDDVGLCLGFLAGDESAERGRRRERGEGEGEGKGEKKCRRITTYVTSLIRRLDLAAMYICNVNLFWFFPTSTSPLPTETTAAFLIRPFKGCSNFHLQIPKRKKEKKERKKNVSYRVVSCR